MEHSSCSLEMLQELGLKSAEELFSDIPKDVRSGGLKLPEGLSELDLRRELDRVLSSNRHAGSMLSFLGAGIYHHYVPSAAKMIVGRSEFITSYTPYQPEISQGMLQSLFEYQSYIAELIGMDVVNSSMYDAATALGEAALMSSRLSGGDTFLVSRAISPERRQVAELYAKGAGIKLIDVAFDQRDGSVDITDLKSKIKDGVSGFYFESPNFFGVIEPKGKEIREALGKKTLVAGVNPMSLALLRPPGDIGADIVIGDAQVFGGSMSFGGPTVGIFGCRPEHVRKMPGRIIGMTTDIDGRPAYCMTLQTREQHIRRSKATSNICSNEALLAVAAASYLSTMGKRGLREVAASNVRNMRSLASRIGALKGFEAPIFKGVHFNEFVVRSDRNPREIHEGLLSQGIHGGLVLTQMFPELGNSALYATTEMHTKEDHDRLISALEGLR